MSRIDKIEERLDKALMNSERIIVILEQRSDQEKRIKNLEEYRAWQVGAFKLIGVLSLILGVVTAAASMITY